MPEKTQPRQVIPLKEQAYHHIKTLVLNEDIPVNSFLSERGLAEQLGMSKTPVRLAIERLENEGFVRVSPQQGIVVVALSLEDILDYTDYRLALECYVVRSIAGTLSEAQIGALQDNLEEQAEVIRSGEREDLVRSDMAFHRLLAEFKGNKQISLALERQQDMLFRVANHIYRRHTLRTEASYKEHGSIAQALIGGEEHRAVTLMTEHIGKIKDSLIESAGV